MPTLSSVHVNGPLSNLAEAYIQERNFLAFSVFPRVPVRKVSDSYFTFNVSDFRRAHSKKRAPGTEAAIVDRNPSTDTFNCLREALKEHISDPVRANTDTPLDLDRAAMENVVSDIMRGVEVDWAAKFFATSKWGTDSTPGTTWDNDTSTPIEDVAAQNRTIETNTGFLGNTFVLGRKVYDDLRNHPDILDRIKYGGGPGNPAKVTPQALAALFDVERVLVARASRDTANEGSAASNAYIVAARSALLVYAAPAPGIMVPSGGYTFVWPGGGSGTDVTVKTYREPEAIESDAIEAELWYDNKLTGSDLGCFFSLATAA